MNDFDIIQKCVAQVKTMMMMIAMMMNSMYMWIHDVNSLASMNNIQP